MRKEDFVQDIHVNDVELKDVLEKRTYKVSMDDGMCRHLLEYKKGGGSGV